MSKIQDSIFEEEVRTAPLDEAHVGDIQGAWGTIRAGDTARRKSWFSRVEGWPIRLNVGCTLAYCV